MKILVFLHGTTIMHRNASYFSRKERVQQAIDNEESVHDFATYIPVGQAVEKIRAWRQQGAEIIYLSSHLSLDEYFGGFEPSVRSVRATLSDKMSQRLGLRATL